MNESFETKGQALGALVDAKKKQYGDSIPFTEELLNLLYPGGIMPGDYSNALIIARVGDKLCRIARGDGSGDEDAWQDIAGYALRMVSR